jgi:hypothetical protein
MNIHVLSLSEFPNGLIRLVFHLIDLVDGTGEGLGERTTIVFGMAVFFMFLWTGISRRLFTDIFSMLPPDL